MRAGAAGGPGGPGGVRFPVPWTARAVLLALAALAGCDRTPRLVPAGADSVAAVPADSTALYVQMARAAWDSPEQAGDAAALTARLLLDDLRAQPPASLAAQARDFLDSLRMGAEIAGRDPAVVNLFARSDPSGASWPYLFWREGGTIRMQSLEAGGLHLAGATLEPPDAARGPGATRIATLFTRAGVAGPQPFAFVWQRAPGAPSWTLAQSLGSDSLGSVGTARAFEPAADGAVLESRTYSIARGFDECASCPHIYRTRRFRWGTAGLLLASDDVERTPYDAFVRFVQALVAGDPEGAQRFTQDRAVVDAAFGYDWGRARGLWRLAPGSAANARDLMIFRGPRDAYRVHFVTRGDAWVITSFEPASRSLE